MARKLSIALGATEMIAAVMYCLVCGVACAQETTAPATLTNLIDNPFAAKKAQVQPAALPAEAKPPRKQPTYQNPFAADSKKPPVDTSLRPGPVSRWRRPALPNDTASVKTALLSSQPVAPEPTWDQLPPADDLRHRLVDRPKESDPAFYSRLARASEPIQFTPKPLAQPAWITGQLE